MAQGVPSGQKMEVSMPKKQSSSKTSTIAGKVLAGKKATKAEATTLAASVLSQDEKNVPCLSG